MSYNDPTLPKAARKAGSKSALVYDELRDAIVSLRLQPGARIDKAALCERLHVSRQPLSEALAWLAEERLVAVEPQKGTYVTRISMRDVAEAAFVRAALEVETVRRLAPEVDAETLQRLSLIVDYQSVASAAKDHEEFYGLDVRFHAALIGRLAFRRVAEVVESSRAQTERIRRLLLPTPDRSSGTITEHRAILAALARRDAAAAGDAMRTHLDNVLLGLQRLSSEQPQLFEP